MSSPRSIRLLGLLACGSLSCADLLGLDDPRTREPSDAGAGASSTVGSTGTTVASSGSGEGGRGAAAGSGGEGGTATSVSTSASIGGAGGAAASSSSTSSNNGGGGGTGGDPGPCALNGSEEPCKECVKNLCCPQLMACSDASCACWKTCVQEGTKDYVTCQTQCGAPTQPVVDLADCVQDLCEVCGL